MKHSYLILALLTGCAQFSTQQRDIRKATDGQVTEITTTVSARTFGTSKSTLANFKATQTDKSQGANVGNLAQESSGTNAVVLIDLLSKALAEALVKSLVPKP